MGSNYNPDSAVAATIAYLADLSSSSSSNSDPSHSSSSDLFFAASAASKTAKSELAQRPSQVISNPSTQQERAAEIIVATVGGGLDWHYSPFKQAQATADKLASMAVFPTPEELQQNQPKPNTKGKGKKKQASAKSAESSNQSQDTTAGNKKTKKKGEVKKGRLDHVAMALDAAVELLLAPSAEGKTTGNYLSGNEKSNKDRENLSACQRYLETPFEAHAAQTADSTEIQQESTAKPTRAAKNTSKASSANANNTNNRKRKRVSEAPPATAAIKKPKAKITKRQRVSALPPPQEDEMMSQASSDSESTHPTQAVRFQESTARLFTPQRPHRTPSSIRRLGEFTVEAITPSNSGRKSKRHPSDLVSPTDSQTTSACGTPPRRLSLGGGRHYVPSSDTPVSDVSPWVSSTARRRQGVVERRSGEVDPYSELSEAEEEGEYAYHSAPEDHDEEEHNGTLCGSSVNEFRASLLEKFLAAGDEEQQVGETKKEVQEREREMRRVRRESHVTLPKRLGSCDSLEILVQTANVFQQEEKVEPTATTAKKSSMKTRSTVKLESQPDECVQILLSLRGNF
ncbi:hypothetical protein HDV05_003694 [Chytridiales sp. JEL 0842]|nr:hypothetical protein HDV05_003694 [Chytridiales sp. JEL 0842]